MTYNVSSEDVSGLKVTMIDEEDNTLGAESPSELHVLTGNVTAVSAELRVLLFPLRNGDAISRSFGQLFGLCWAGENRSVLPGKNLLKMPKKRN